MIIKINKMETQTDEISKKLDLADSWLTKLGIILVKHWGKLTLLLIAYFFYWALTQPVDAVVYPPQNEFQEPVPVATDSIYGEHYTQDTLEYYSDSI